MSSNEQMIFFQMSKFHTEHTYTPEINFSMCEQNCLKISPNETGRGFQIWRLDESTAKSQQTNLLVMEVSPYKLNLKTRLNFYRVM